MWQVHPKEGWASKNWCFSTVVLVKILESPLDCKEIQPVHSEGDQSWVFIGRTDAKAETPIFWATSCEELTHWKRLRCWEGLEAGEGDDRGWDGWVASPTQWTWVWVNSGRWWWTGRSGVLRFMGSQRVGHDWVTELKLREAEDVKKRWQEYLEEIYKKDLHDPDNHNGVITHQELELYWSVKSSGP